MRPGRGGPADVRRQGPQAADRRSRRRRIAASDAAALIGALLFLVFLTMPVAESENFPANWFQGLYYGVLGIASLLAGWLTAVVIMLYSTVSDIVEVSGLRRTDHPLLASDPESDGERCRPPPSETINSPARSRA